MIATDEVVSGFLCALVMTVASVRADLRLPAVISDHAMLQADKPVAIWGWADPGAQVKVAFVGQVPLQTVAKARFKILQRAGRRFRSAPRLEKFRPIFGR